jgi:hypothetical protein
MKLVDIDKCDRQVFYKELGTKDGKDVCIFAETVFDMLEALPPVNAIPIPEGATNGDMIKVMFPNIEADEIQTNTGGYIDVKYLDTTDACDSTAFRRDWWNAPYKK